MTVKLWFIVSIVSLTISLAQAKPVWVWSLGSKDHNVEPVYSKGDQSGTAAVSLDPGNRMSSILAFRAVDNTLILYGGDSSETGSDAIPHRNDLWSLKYDSMTWTFLGNENGPNPSGTDRPLGEQSTSKWPGARDETAGTYNPDMDQFYIFGGTDSSSESNSCELSQIIYQMTLKSIVQYLNELWAYSFKSGQWTLLSGSDQLKQPSTANMPRGRSNCLMIYNTAKKSLIVYGGFFQLDSSAVPGLSDLWEFNLITKKWALLSGSATTFNEEPFYGVMNKPGSAKPGMRYETHYFYRPVSNSLYIMGDRICWFHREPF